MIPDNSLVPAESEQSLSLIDFASHIEELTHMLRRAVRFEELLIDARRDPETQAQRREMLSTQADETIGDIRNRLDSRESGVRSSGELEEELSILGHLSTCVKLGPPPVTLTGVEQDTFSALAFKLQERLKGAATGILKEPVDPLLPYCISGTIDAMTDRRPSRLFAPENIAVDDVVDDLFVPARIFCTASSRRALGTPSSLEGINDALTEITSVYEKVAERLLLRNELQSVLSAAGVVDLNGVFQHDLPKGRWNPEGSAPAFADIFTRFPEEARWLPMSFKDLLEDKALLDQMQETCGGLEARKAAAAGGRELRKIEKKLSAGYESLKDYERCLCETWWSFIDRLKGFASELALLKSGNERLLTESETVRSGFRTGTSLLSADSARAEELATAAELISSIKTGLENASGLEGMQQLLAKKIEKLEAEDITPLDSKEEARLEYILKQLQVPHRGVTQHFSECPPPQTPEGFTAMEQLMRCTVAYAVIQASKEVAPFYVRYLDETGELAARRLGVAGHLNDMPGSPEFWRAVKQCLSGNLIPSPPFAGFTNVNIARILGR